MNKSIEQRVDWKTMPDSTRVWIYQAQRCLTDSEVEEIRLLSDHFVSDWTSHGASMEAVIEVFHQRFIVVFADESKAQASGCGIDKSVHFMQALEERYNIELFDRMTLCYLDGESVKSCILSEIPELVQKGSLSQGTIFFDNLVPDKASLISRWKTPMGESWTRRYFS